MASCGPFIQQHERAHSMNFCTIYMAQSCVQASKALAIVTVERSHHLQSTTPNRSKHCPAAQQAQQTAGQECSCRSLRRYVHDELETLALALASACMPAQVNLSSVTYQSYSHWAHQFLASTRSSKQNEQQVNNSSHTATTISHTVLMSSHRYYSILDMPTMTTSASTGMSVQVVQVCCICSADLDKNYHECSARPREGPSKTAPRARKLWLNRQTIVLDGLPISLI